MSCDTAHSLWSGRMGLRLAVRRGRVVVRGDEAAVFEFVPLMTPAFERYPEIVEAAGILTEPQAVA
jgi:hypothetical protein